MEEVGERRTVDGIGSVPMKATRSIASLIKRLAPQREISKRSTEQPEDHAYRSIAHFESMTLAPRLRRRNLTDTQLIVEE